MQHQVRACVTTSGQQASYGSQTRLPRQSQSVQQRLDGILKRLYVARRGRRAVRSARDPGRSPGVRQDRRTMLPPGVLGLDHESEQAL
ncbi:MAG: hypothetical protein AB7U23_11355 [Dehalococcoidia bacterium]